MDITVDKLLATYPNAKHAVSWVELFIVGKEDDEPQSAWDMMMSAKMYPQQIVDALKETIEGETIGKAQLARAEMDHPEFRQYICGRMGCY